MSTTTTNGDAEVTQRRKVPLPTAQGMNRGVKLQLVLVGLLLAGLAVGGYFWAMREAPLAKLHEVQGTTERDSIAAVALWRAAKPGDEFFAGEGARTSALAEARFRLLGGAVLRLNPESIVRFHRRARGAPIKVDVEMGEVDVQSGVSALTIDSEFGPLVLDANSAVSLSRDGASMIVEVELGGLQMSERAVTAGDKLRFELGGIVVDLPPPIATAPPIDTAPVVAPPPVASRAGGEPADLVTQAGASLVIHDPSPPTALGIATGGVCKGPARLTSGDQVTEGVGQLNLRLAPGQHTYRVACLDDPERVVAQGKVGVVRDTGTKRLPTFAPTANIVTDGRAYTVMYQHKLPNVSVSWPTAPTAEKYTLRVDGRVITTKSPHHTLRSLSNGRHKLTFSAATAPVRTSRTTTIEVQRDIQAPTGEVADPPLDFEASELVTVRGNALPGWSVSVGGKELTMDGQRTFSTQANGNQTIPIVFTHPTYGTHYYLRRPKVSP